jgi:hypothetical protein
MPATILVVRGHLLPPDVVADQGFGRLHEAVAHSTDVLLDEDGA